MHPVTVNSSCSKWHIARFSLLLLLAWTACSQQQSRSPVLEGLYRFTTFRLAPGTRAIVILADNSCMSCNRQLSDLMAGYLERKDIQFVLSVHESVIDISPYQQSARKDLVFDYNHRLTDNGIIKGSTLLFLKNKAVDTMVQLDAATLEAQIAFLKSRLNE